MERNSKNYYFYYTREDYLDEREQAITEREKNINQTEQDIRENAEKKIREQKSRAKEKAENDVASFRKTYTGVFISLSMICAIQLMLNVFVQIDYTILQERWAMFIDTIFSIPTWSIQRIILTAVIGIAILAFFGYQYIKRFFDEFTLFSILLDLMLIEYFAAPLIRQDCSLGLFFLIFQLFYVAFRDYLSDNSGMRKFYCYITGIRYNG